MIVLDASAAVLGLLSAGDARRVMTDEACAVPHLADSEVAHALRGQVLADRIAVRNAQDALQRWGRLGIRRFAAVGLLARVWELRENLSAYDATYVSLAEALACSLVTADARIARAPGPRCPVTVVRG